MDVKQHSANWTRVQELCESRGGRPEFPSLISLTVSVDVKQHWIMLRHWSQCVPNRSTDVHWHEARIHHQGKWNKGRGGRESGNETFCNFKSTAFKVPPSLSLSTEAVSLLSRSGLPPTWRQRLWDVAPWPAGQSRLILLIGSDAGAFRCRWIVQRQERS